jgi:GTP cyclohydrolase I
MSSTVRALEPIRGQHHGSRPDRSGVEAATRTIIRGSGDNPDRDGLIETPARATRALEKASLDTLTIRTRSFKSHSTRSKDTMR